MKILIAETERIALPLLQKSSLSQRYQIERFTNQPSELKPVENSSEQKLSADFQPTLRSQLFVGADVDLIVIDADWTAVDAPNSLLNGVWLCQQLRVQGISNPILLLTPPSANQGVLTLEAGANDYLTKPFDAATLISRVTYLLQRNQVPNKLNRARLLAEITNAIHQTLELDQILQTAVTQLRSFLQADRVIVFRFNPDWQGIVESESVAPGWVETLGMNIQDSCFNDQYIENYSLGRVSVISDIETLDVSPCYLELLKSIQVRANLVVPIVQENHLWGLLIAHQCGVSRQWTPQNTQLLQRVATQLGIAIQQAELHQTTREQAALIDIATDAIFVRDLAGRIVFWSKGASQMYGWSQEEAIGQTVQLLLKTQANINLEVTLSTAIEQGSWQGELTHKTQSGKTILVASRWTLLRDEKGRPQSFLEVNTDITEKKRLEAQFYQAQRLESLGQLAGGVAHDLGNILTPVLGIAQLLRITLKDLGEPTQEHIEILERSAKRGVAMVQQILTFAQGSPDDGSTVDITTLLKEVIDVARQGIPNNIEIRQNIFTENSPNSRNEVVRVNATHLHQVFMNLCVNARDAMPTGGVLTISIDNVLIDQKTVGEYLDKSVGQCSVGHYVTITVTDTGVGIEPGVRDRIFDPFFTTKPPNKGTGLGLATVLGIVKNAGGFLQVLSDIGQGTEIKVYFPIVES